VDPRVKYLANVAASIFGIMQLAPKIAQSNDVLKFLEEENAKVMQIFTNGESVKVNVSSVGIPPANIMECTFIKNMSSGED